MAQIKELEAARGSYKIKNLPAGKPEGSFYIVFGVLSEKIGDLLGLKPVRSYWCQDFKRSP